MAVAVDVGGVDEVDASIGGGVEGGQAVAVVDGAPVGPDGPRAEADGADLVSGLAKSSVLHGLSVAL